jgi:glyoxylase-like metal-dependent hydrolase (beta-lactamase superfamily II)
MRQEVENYLLQRENKDVKVEALVEGVYAVTGFIANVGLIKVGEKSILVDTGESESFDILLDRIRDTANLSDVMHIFNTHHHMDHIGGNLSFSKTGKVIAQRKMFNRLEENFKDLTSEFDVDEYLKLDVPNFVIEAFCFGKAHTDNDLSVFVNRNQVVFTGDVFTNGYFPFFDKSEGGSVLEWADYIESILQKVDESSIIVPGHGPLASKDDLIRFNQMILDSVEYVKACANKGMSIEKICELDLPIGLQEWERTSRNKEIWLIGVYDSLND